MDDEEDICRVCRLEGSDDHPLFHPCLCTGSIRYVHQDCLLQWLRHSRHKNCEVCKHPIAFRPVYSAAMPSRLGATEFVAGVIKRIARMAQKWIRFAFVVCVWAAAVPFATSRIWHALFSLDEEGEAQESAGAETSMLRSIASDCLLGFVVASTTVVLFFSLMSLRDFIVASMAEIFPEIAQNDAGDAPVDGNDRRANNGGWLDVDPADFPDAAADADDDDRPDEGANNADLGGEGGGMFGILDGNGDEVNLPDFLGFSGPVTRVAVHAFWAVVFIACFVFMFGYLPYITGEAVRSVTLAAREPSATAPTSKWITGSSKLDASLTVFVGYVAIGSAASLLLIVGGAVVSSRATAAAASANAGENPPRMSGLSRVAWMVSTFFKVCFLLVCELVFFPLGFGWWLDLCTLDLFGLTLDTRRRMALSMPVSSAAIHWMLGMVFMFHFGSFVSVVRDSLRPGILFFLRDPNNPNFHPVREMVRLPMLRHIRRLATSIVLYGGVVLLNVYVPVAVIRRLVPSLVPLRLTFGTSIMDVPVDLLLFNLAVPFCADRLRPRDKFEWLLTRWAVVVGYVLDLESYLLKGRIASVDAANEDSEDDDSSDDSDEQPYNGGDSDSPSDNDVEEEPRRILRPRRVAAGRDGPERPQRAAEGRHAERPQEHARRRRRQQPQGRPRERPQRAPAEEGELVQGALPNGDPFVPYRRPSAFVPRVIALVVIAWLTMATFNTLVVVAPVVIGRVVAAWVTADGVHEMYTFMIGLYCIWAASAIVAHARTLWMWASNWGWIAAAVKSFAKKASTAAVIMAVFGGLLPLQLGLLFDCVVVVPSRVSLSETPLFHLGQDWALGVLYLKLAHTLLPMMPHSDFKAAVAEWELNGFAAIGLVGTLRRIALPLCSNLALALAVPYVVARGLVPALGLGDTAEAFAFRHGFQAFVLVAAVSHFLPQIRSGIAALYSAVRDDRYLVGRQLVNHPGR